MTDENVYVRSGTRSKMSADLPVEEEEGREENWDFELEAWNVVPAVHEGHFVQHAGIKAAVETLGELTACQTCRVEYVRPRTPVSDPAQVCNIFPGVIAYPRRTVWILGLKDLSVNRDTGCREVTVYLVSSDNKPHFTALPDGAVKLYRHYFILETVGLPSWIQEAIQ